MTLDGTNGKKVTIITAYRVCSGSPQSAPIGSSFLREYEFFRENHYTSLNPRRLFFTDLQTTIIDLQKTGHCVVLMLDANSTLDDGNFQLFIAACGLHDLHSTDPAPSTYIGSSNRRIDFIFGCDEVTQYVTRSGSLSYTDGPQSDHRSLYVDLSPDFIKSPPWQTILPSTSRDLHTGNPELVHLYHTSMLEYYEQHCMVARMQSLFASKDSLDREELRTALIKWDNDQGRAMEFSERTLRRPQKKSSWSPKLRNSAIIRRYWLLRLRESTRQEDYTATFSRWQRSVQTHDASFYLPFFGQSLSTEQIRAHLNASNRTFRAIQTQSIPIRLRTYQELLEQYQDDTDPNTKDDSRRKAKIVRNTIDGESIRKVFGNLRSIVKPSESSTLSKILVPTNTMLDLDHSSSYRITQESSIETIQWETIIDRDQIDRHLLQYNRDSFRAASSSPCGHGIIHDALTFSSLSPESEQILSGTIPEDWCGRDNHLREFLASFVIPPQVEAHGEIQTSISDADIIYGFKGWKERTSTSPSGRHLGHYKALIQHPTLLKCFSQFMNIVVLRGIAIPRWCQATNVMIEKDAGKPCINRLRIIHLFEADFNFFLKLQWGHRLVRHAVSLDLLHDSQHGSVPRRTALDPIMLTQLTSDLCRILKHDLARFDNDASACYDRIIVALGMLAARRCGMPRNAIRLHADALRFMKYTVKTMYGISTENYHGTPFAPLFGTGQGSGASPAVWLSLIVLLLHTFDRMIPHRMNFVPISGAREHSRSSDAFVDDTSVGFTSTRDDMEYSDLILQLQAAAQTWEKLLSLSGGQLNLKKCSWYVLRWEWKNGRPLLRKIEKDDPTISLTQGDSSTSVPIKQHSPTHSSRMLGVYLNPMGDFSDHLVVLKKKADDFSRRIMSPRLSAADISIFHRSIYIPSMRYGLAAVAANEQSLGIVQSNVLKSILQKLHISSTIPTSLRHGPIELGGLGLYDLRTEVGIEAIKFLRNSLYSDSETGNLIRLNLQYSQRESGVGFHLLEHPNTHISYLTPSWILSIRQFLSNNNMSIQVSDIHMDTPQGPTDTYIMQSDHLLRYEPAQQIDINLVRLWLQVATLSEISDPSRPNRVLLSYLDGTRPPGFTPSATWPRQSPPTKSQIRLWKGYIKSSFLRYIPYWKTPPTSSTVIVPEPPIIPTRLSDYSEYLASSCFSRTEQRLLDGLQQVATDVQINKAFRSKSRLHLASDGGLGDNSATHGWILSTGTIVLYKCSGPVDGPFDTNSSTRSELGGCASSLLFLSSLSTFWGYRHRCSFRWYTDSKSAISRFHKFSGRGRRSTRMPPDADLLSIISTCRRKLRRPFTPIWVRAHQDDTMAYDKLPLAARLNIDADFLATRYRQHGRLKAGFAITHRHDQQISLYINGVPVTSQYDECIRFHINGYHHRNYVQNHHEWSNKTWDDIDFYTFGRHFRNLASSHRSQHFKFVHDQLPLGIRRYREATIKDASLQTCPCCKIHIEDSLHFLRCKSNPSHDSSLSTLRSDILNHDSHPVRYLLADGFCHFFTSDTPFSPSIAQFPPHFQDHIPEALSNQHTIGWSNSIKGYLSKSWGNMAQYDMHRNSRDKRMGDLRMKQIHVALSSHVRRLWLSRNDSLHSTDDATLATIRSAETVEIMHYYSNPNLLRTGDQHYCRRSLSKLLSGTPATRRRWLRKVRQSSAELTKDGTSQTLLTTFFRPT
jgi:hypothetical protein